MNEGMLTMKKLFALMLALALMVTVVCAFAEGDGGDTGGGQTTTGTTSTPSITIKTTSKDGEAAVDTTQYTYYRILEADIGTDPQINDVYQSGGAVSYHTDSQAKATALENSGVFKVTRVGNSDRWYVELLNPDATGAQVAAGIATMDLSIFPSATFSQTEVAGTATSGPIAPGYYYVTSTAGKNVAVQTLTAVEINEKNEFPTITKEVDEDDEDAQIGDEITFTIKVKVPSTANDKIVLKDTMSAGLSFKSIDSMKMGGSNGTDVGASNYTVATTTDGFTLTLPAALVADAAAAAENESTKVTEIEIICTAVLDGDAQTANPETNSVTLDYGEHYTTKPKTAEVKTYDFKFNKIDGNTKDQLAGAEFQFLLSGSPMKLIEVEAGKEYRIAMPDEAGTTETITTIGETVRIYGLDIDVQAYSLQETKAPTGGYKILKDAVPVKASGDSFGEIDVENNEGTVLPSTGGSGTTIFYVIGGLLIIGAGIVLVARRKVHE
uniref:Putative LPXTG-motif cell wall anchor domain protein n=1 Tax=uncultured bacterium Contig20b TaxID=1393534 RepID=W0FKH1_9BACT|nr:putative LPXTG-motif cell wall anchor domain protein [uncultured bacterium Contig20b]